MIFARIRTFNITIFFLTVSCVLAFSLSACQKNDSDTQSVLNPFNSSVEDITSTLDSTTKETREQIGKYAEEEIKKFLTIEYRVFSLSTKLSDQEIEEQLQKIGKERWNCFHIEIVDDQSRFYCNRLPISALKLFPLLWNLL
jgi:hypothetical protein